VRFVSCVWLPLSARADLTEAIATVDRTIAARQERDFGVFTALGADYRVHFPRWPAAIAATVGFPCLATRRTPLGVVGETFAGKELLLVGIERESSAAVEALK
jgi:hypothetical protein